MDNDGVGTMGAFMELKETQLEQEATHVTNAEEEDLGKIDDTVAIVGEARGPSKMNHAFTKKLEDRPTKYIILEEGKGWVLRTMAELWRIHKSRVKAEYYTKYSTDKERLQNMPASIPLEKFKVLLEYWGDEDVQTKAKNKKKMPQTPRKGHIYPKTRKNPTEVEGDAAETGGDSEAEEVQLDFDGLGPNWLVGRIGITRKTKKDAMKIERTNSAKLEKLREDLASEMEKKMNKKLEKILGKLAEENPSLNINGVKISLSTTAGSGPSSLDYDTLHLIWTPEKLQQQLDVIDQRYEILTGKALASLKSGIKVIAQRHTRELKLDSQSREKYTTLLNRVEEVIRVLADAESSKQVTQAIQIGARAIKENSTSVDEVQRCLEELDESIAMQKEVEDFLQTEQRPCSNLDPFSNGNDVLFMGKVELYMVRKYILMVGHFIIYSSASSSGQGQSPV
ncbi:hypothetical protein AgCh_036076 [Apium graveolens]